MFIVPGVTHGAFQLAVERLGEHAALIPSQLPVCKPSARLAKRLFDLATASFFGVFALPICLVAAAAIRLETVGPVLFRQERVGRGGKTFQMLKLRTMRPNAGESWTTPGDARVTRVGAILRRFSIDELPQLVNVLAGDMSIVGPRPEMKAFAEAFARQFANYNERHLVAPGITGWSQVNLKRVLTPQDVVEVLQHDLFYVENWSLYMDLSIVFKTIVEILFHQAA
jgi:lipopolysaccharide/colanic/teichoic acid biosynthesis glycosyltransferase